VTTERSYHWSDIPHLAQRTLWSLRKPAPDANDQAWLLSLLTPVEAVLYRSMDQVDQSHALVCARAVQSLGDEVAVASALHDVGKNQAGLGTPGRVLASLAGLLIADLARRWDSASGLRGQIGRYLDHPELGAAALRRAGASDLAVAWAREHHWPPGQHTIDPDLVAALLDADE